MSPTSVSTAAVAALVLCSPAPLGAAPSRLPDGATPSAAEEAAIARELAGLSPRSSPPARALSPRPAPGANATSRGLSNLLNPAISGVVLLLGGASSRARPGPEGAEGGGSEDLEELQAGLSLQEVELRLSGVVDPYLRADLTLAAHGEEMHFEEAFVTSLELPRVTVKAGQMYAAFGRHNGLHTHAFPMISAPLPSRALLGGDGMSDVGVSASVLLPLPVFVEATAQVFEGDMAPFAPKAFEEGEEIDLRRPWDLAWLGRLQTVWDVGQSSAFALGLSWLGGRGAGGGLVQVMGVDLHLKRPPPGGLRRGALSAGLEAVLLRRPDDPDGAQGGAWVTAGGQATARWWLRGRVALLGRPGSRGATRRAETLLAFLPSETAAFRLQYAFERPAPGGGRPGRDVHEIFLQAVAAIGPHPAHPW